MEESLYAMAGREARALAVFAAMAGSVLGAALQLRQPALWHWASYAGLLAAAGVGWFGLRSQTWRAAAWLSMALLLGAAAGFGLAGCRAVAYAAGALSPEVEGRDLRVEGQVASMPQHGSGSVRFSFEVDSAAWVDPAAAQADPMPRVPPESRWVGTSKAAGSGPVA